MKAEFNYHLKIAQSDYKKVMASIVDGVYLYGAGFIGRWAVDYLERNGLPVLGFVDSNQEKWGKFINGKQVFSPSENCIFEAKTILITSRHAVHAVKKSLSHLNAAIMSIDALVVIHSSKNQIEKITKLLEHDHKSIQTFYAVISAMLSGSTRSLKPIANNKPFFDIFGFFNRNEEIFVDAGSYVGDSLERFIWSVNGVFRHIHAFEPGPLQFKALKKRVERLRQEWALTEDSISLINKGITSENRIARIDNSTNLIQTKVYDNDSFHNDSSINIETTSLDSYFDGNNFTFLKVDIEGSESALLQGARKSINKFRPRIALSVYHYPTDIFDLPLQLNSLNTDYSFQLRHHSSQLMDTVLYAKDENE